MAAAARARPGNGTLKAAERGRGPTRGGGEEEEEGEGTITGTTERPRGRPWGSGRAAATDTTVSGGACLSQIEL